MASLTGQSIASSYKDLLQVSNSNSGIDGTARVVSDGEDTASKLFLDTGRVGVGIAPTDGTLHVHTATAGSIGADSAADDLVVENSESGGITILTPNDALGQLAFGSPADAYGAFIGWKSDDNQMTIATANAGDSIVMQTANKVTALTIDSSQNVGVGTGSPKHYSGTSGTVLSIHDSSFRGILELSGASNSDGGVIGALTFANTENTAANGALAQLYTEVETSDSNAGDDSGGHLLFFTKPEAGTLTQRMKIDSSGNTIIGTHNSNAHRLAIESRHASVPFGQLVAGSSDQNQAVGFQFTVRDSDGSERDKMYLTNTGLGIGIDSPSQLLHVKNSGVGHAHVNIESTDNTYVSFLQLATNGNDWQIAAGGSSHSTFADSFYIYDTTNSRSTFRLDANSRISLSNNDNNSNNTVFGSSAFNASSNNGSDNNTAIGYLAMGTGTVSGAENNTAVGRSALTDITSADNNTAVGFASAGNITTGERNTAIGADALGLSTTGLRNVAIGNLAMYASPAGVAIADMIAIGKSALGGGIHTTDANGSIAIGTEAGTKITEAIGNLAIGYKALAENTTGDYNIAIGHNAMNSQQAGGTQNVSATSHNNLYIGVDAGGGNYADAQSNYNIGIGNGTLAGAMNGALQNTAVGYNSLSAVTQGDNNVALGINAGDSITTGTKNICIGQNTDPSAVGATNQIVIGATATGQADNSVTLGNADVTDVYMAQDSGATVHADKYLSTTNPAFQVQNSVDHLNIAVGSAYIDKTFDTEIFDQGSNFASNVFTAPVTGKYLLISKLAFQSADATAAVLYNKLVTSNREYTTIGGGGLDDDTTIHLDVTVVADMDANDTAKVQYRQIGGAAQADVVTSSFFAGYLLG